MLWLFVQGVDRKADIVLVYLSAECTVIAPFCAESISSRHYMYAKAKARFRCISDRIESVKGGFLVLNLLTTAAFSRLMSAQEKRLDPYYKGFSDSSGLI